MAVHSKAPVVTVKKRHQMGKNTRQMLTPNPLQRSLYVWHCRQHLFPDNRDRGNHRQRNQVSWAYSIMFWFLWFSSVFSLTFYCILFYIFFLVGDMVKPSTSNAFETVVALRKLFVYWFQESCKHKNGSKIYRLSFAFANIKYLSNLPYIRTSCWNLPSWHDGYYQSGM